MVCLRFFSFFKTSLVCLKNDKKDDNIIFQNCSVLYEIILCQNSKLETIPDWIGGAWFRQHMLLETF